MILQKKKEKEDAGNDSDDTLATTARGRRKGEVEEPTFKPQINVRSKNIKRDEDVVDHLTVDAERRATRREKEIEKKANKDAQESRMNMVKPCSKDSKNIVYQAFEREYLEVLESFELDEESLVSEITAVEIMVKLGFISQSSEADLEHAGEIWRNLHPEENENAENENE